MRIVTKDFADQKPPQPVAWLAPFLWLLAGIFLFYTLLTAFQQYAAPNPYAGNPLASFYYDRARTAELWGRLLMATVPACAGLYLAWKSQALRVKIAGELLIFLLLVNVLFFR